MGIINVGMLDISLASQPQTRRYSVAVAGDSLAYGLGASDERAGLTQRLFQAIRERHPGSTFANYAVAHATMGDVLRHQVPQLHGTQCDLVILIAGANDLRYTADRIVFARRFRHLVGAVHQAAPQARVVVGGMPDVTQTIGIHRLMKAPVSRLCARLNDIMRRIAAEFGDGFIDLYTYTNSPLQPDRAYLCEDGYHPNDFGYEEIAGRALPAIWEVLRSPDTASTVSPDDGPSETSTRA